MASDEGDHLEVAPSHPESFLRLLPRDPSLGSFRRDTFGTALLEPVKSDRRPGLAASPFLGRRRECWTPSVSPQRVTQLTEIERRTAEVAPRDFRHTSTRRFAPETRKAIAGRPTAPRPLPPHHPAPDTHRPPCRRPAANPDSPSPRLHLDSLPIPFFPHTATPSTNPHHLAASVPTPVTPYGAGAGSGRRQRTTTAIAVSFLTRRRCGAGCSRRTPVGDRRADSSASGCVLAALGTRPAAPLFGQVRPPGGRPCLGARAQSAAASCLSRARPSVRWRFVHV